MYEGREATIVGGARGGEFYVQSRYHLHDDGTFELQWEREDGHKDSYAGHYSRSDSAVRVDYDFGWTLTGTLDEDRLEVEHSPAMAINGDPGGGVYVLCSID